MAAAAAAVAAGDKSEGRVLLPSTVEPVSYDIRITPDLEKFTFDGSEDVAVVVVAATTEIQLHARELHISEASFTATGGQGGVRMDAVEVRTHLKDHVVTIVFAEELPVGPGVLSITFRGEINNQMAGFYRSQYVDAEGNKKWMGSTQFEALDARRAFPCWDEPGRKATFTLSLTIPKDMEALSNMPQAEHVIQSGGRRRIKFLPTPKMSTYLLCWCVGEFDSVSALTKSGVLCKVFTPPGRGESGRFALDVAVRTLELYDDFFRVPYPLPKLDMIAIMDFAMGAMENWGLVTYREVDLLIDEAKASSAQRQRVATVVTHELAHQWFGNLVTMQWWDDLWLNEGFASWTQTFAADALFPDWGLWTQFVCDDQSAALRLDALKTSHPIQVPIKRAEEVEEVFDAISYCKGASVVRMIHSVLGHEKFQQGLQVYMERHQYSNTETFHLWRAWEEVSQKPIAAIMGSWTEQMGFPLVSVTARRVNDDDKSVTLSLTQRWFLGDGSEPDDRLWTIPITFQAEGAAASSEAVLMTGRTMELTVPAVNGATPRWVKLNAGQHVPMRVAYDDVRPLADAVQSMQLCPEDRAGLLLDAYALAKAKHPSTDAAALLTLVGAYRNESHATVWEALATVLVGLDKLLLAAGEGAAALRRAYVQWAASLIKPAAQRVGWVARDDDGHLGKLLRSTLISLQARFCASDPEVQRTAQDMWDAYFETLEGNTAAIPADYKVPVFSIVLKNTAGPAAFEKLMAHLDLLTANAERKHVYHAIGSVPDVALKRRVLEWATSGAVKLQDFFYPIGSVSGSSPEGLQLAWSFFQENFSAVQALLKKASPSLMDAVIVYSVAGFATEAKADEIAAFFDANPLPQSARKISQTVESIRTNAKFLESILACNIQPVLEA